VVKMPKFMLIFRGGAPEVPDLSPTEMPQHLNNRGPLFSARVIGRDEVIAIGKPGEQGLEHPRRRRKSMQQEKRGRVFWTGLSIATGRCE
jgi:hypothetical protein